MVTDCYRIEYHWSIIVHYHNNSARDKKVRWKISIKPNMHFGMNKF